MLAGEPPRIGIFPSTAREPPHPARLTQKGTFDFTTENSESVELLVVFESTGERFTVRLPYDLRCALAAQRIIADIFFRDIPADRRMAYLAPGANYRIRRAPRAVITGGTGLQPIEGAYNEQTLREAGFKDGDSITIETEIPFPWAHFPPAAQLELNAHHSQWYTSAKYRLAQYVGISINNRLVKRTGLSLDGPMYDHQDNTVRPWVSVDPMWFGPW